MKLFSYKRFLKKASFVCLELRSALPALSCCVLCSFSPLQPGLLHRGQGTGGMGPDFHPFCVFLPPWGYESPAQVELTSQPHVKL